MFWRQYNGFYNFLWYQSIWFTSILGGSQFEWALLALLVLHITLCEQRLVELRLMLAGAAIGLSVDTMLTYAGVFSFTEQPTLLPIPLWLAAIWLGFCGTLRHSLAFMAKRPLLMSLAAGFSAPMSYLGAMRLGAVEYPFGAWPTALIVSVCWMLMIPVILWLHRQFTTHEETSAENIHPQTDEDLVTYEQA